MLLTIEDIKAMRRRLVAVRERGKEYFAEADPEKVADEAAWPHFETWEIRDAKTLQECEALRQTIKELSVDIAAAARASPLLADADMQELRHNTRQMLANVYFREYRHTGVYVHHDEGTVLGVDPPTHEEIPLGDASTAPRRFDQAVAKTLDLADLLLPADATELTPPGTAIYRPNTAFVMMAIDENNPELEDIRIMIKEAFKDFGIEAVAADEIEHEEAITDRIPFRDRIQRVPHCRPDTRASERVLRDRARARPEQACDTGAQEGHEAALRRCPSQLPGIRELDRFEEAAAQTFGRHDEQEKTCWRSVGRLI